MLRIRNFDIFEFKNFAIIFTIPLPIYSLPLTIHKHATISIIPKLLIVQLHRYFRIKNILS